MQGRVIVLAPGEAPEEVPAGDFSKVRCVCGPVHRSITLLSERWRVVLTYKGTGPRDLRRIWDDDLQMPCKIAIAYGDEEFIATAGEGR